MHQFDKFEAEDAPWEVCEGKNDQSHWCGGGSMIGYLSAFIAFRKMHERADRYGVPLIGYSGGVVANPRVPISCAYGDDATTFFAGCRDNSRCNRHRPWDGGNKWADWPCGFGPANSVNMAWNPEDLDVVLRFYTQHSQPYKDPQFYSGYNEVLYAADVWNDMLPHSIDAFFILKEPRSDNHAQTLSAYEKFLRKYGFDAEQVPLLTFDPFNWDAPFSTSLPAWIKDRVAQFSP